jgi:hypothetical protein
MPKNVIFFIILLAFIAIMTIFIWKQMNGGEFWAERYSKEITKLINSAKSGDEITLDVQEATRIAKRNDMKDYKNIFSFDNDENKVCTSLYPGIKKCYYFFNEVNVTPNFKLDPINGNKLHLTIGEANK